MDSRQHQTEAICAPSAPELYPISLVMNSINNSNEEIFEIFDSNRNLVVTNNEQQQQQHKRNSQTSLDPSSLEDHSTEHRRSHHQRRCAVNTDQFQRKFSRKQRLRLAVLHYFRSDSIARFIFVCLCFVWFMINFVTVFKDFLSFDTIVYMEYRSPKQTLPPGITFCTHCIYCGLSNYSEKDMLVHRAILNNIDKDEDIWNDHNQSFIASNMKLNTKLQIISLNLTDFIEYCRFYPNSLSKTLNNGTGEYYDCHQLAPVVVSMQEGHKCFTYFSDIFGAVSQKNSQPYIDSENDHTNNSSKQNKTKLTMLMEFDRFPYLEIRVKGKYLQASSFLKKTMENEKNEKQQHQNRSSNIHGSDIREMVGIFLSIHSPSILPDMLSLSYHRLFPRKFTQIQFLKMIEQKKPWPYRTHCYHYDRMSNETPSNRSSTVFNSWDAINHQELYLFRSRGECFIYCMWRRLGHRKDCLNFYTIFNEHLYTLERQNRIFQKMIKAMSEAKVNKNFEHELDSFLELIKNFFTKFEMHFCNVQKSYKVYGDVKRLCLDHCPSKCNSETFWIDTSYNLDMNSADNSSMIRIEWSTEPVVYIEHREKFSMSGFLGNIGGHAHIWLGISVIAICRFIIQIIKTRSFQLGNCFLWFIRWFRGFHIMHK